MAIMHVLVFIGHSIGNERFLVVAKTRLAWFCRMRKATFCAHLKECGFRGSNRNKNRYDMLLREIRDNHLFDASSIVHARKA